MEWTGERYIPIVSGELGCEHMNRYYFAVNQIDMKDKVVLDIASGEGYGANILSKTAKYVYGIDISIEAIEHAKKNYNRENLEFIHGDALLIPMENNSVDILVSFETIEHIEKQQEMIDEMKRVLTQDGILIISSPDKLRFTDLTGDKHDFHVKELYYSEFKELINKNFSKTHFFNQKIFVGSVISLDEGCAKYSKPLIVDNKGNKSAFEPKYNIAIATDSKSLSLNYAMINYTENDRMITPEELRHANYEGQRHVSSSLSYKVGSILVKPIRRITSLMNFFLAMLF